jgi:hypothetical protein
MRSWVKDEASDEGCSFLFMLSPVFVPRVCLLLSFRGTLVCPCAHQLSSIAMSCSVDRLALNDWPGKPDDRFTRFAHVQFSLDPEPGSQPYRITVNPLPS